MLTLQGDEPLDLSVSAGAGASGDRSGQTITAADGAQRKNIYSCIFK